MYAFVYVYMYACIHVYMCICICRYVYMYMYMYVCRHIYIYTHMHTKKHRKHSDALASKLTGVSEAPSRRDLPGWVFLSCEGRKSLPCDFKHPQASNIEYGSQYVGSLLYGMLLVFGFGGCSLLGRGDHLPKQQARDHRNTKGPLNGTPRFLM